MTLMAVIACDGRAILLQQPLRKLGHHKPGNLLPRSVVVEVAGVAVIALNTERLGESVHYLHQAFAGNSLEHLKTGEFLADSAVKWTRPQRSWMTLVAVVAGQRASIFVLHRHRVVTHHQTRNGLPWRFGFERAHMTEVALDSEGGCDVPHLG